MQQRNIRFPVFFHFNDRFVADPDKTRITLSVQDTDSVASLLDKAAEKLRREPYFIPVEFYDISLYASSTAAPQKDSAQQMRNRKNFEEEKQLKIDAQKKENADRKKKVLEDKKKDSGVLSIDDLTAQFNMPLHPSEGAIRDS